MQENMERKQTKMMREKIRWDIIFVLLLVIGSLWMGMNAGIDSEKLSNLIFVTGSIIMIPTRTSAGAVAADGIERKRGEKKRAMAKQPAITRAVRPERPP